MAELKDTVRISADGIYRGISVHTPYPLEESDFLKLTKVTSFIPIWAHTFFAGAAFFVITVAAKWADNTLWAGTNEISRTEFVILIFLVVAAIAFEGLYLLCPSDKKNTISKIANHFKINKPQPAGFDHE